MNGLGWGDRTKRQAGMVYAARFLDAGGGVGFMRCAMPHRWWAGGAQTRERREGVRLGARRGRGGEVTVCGDCRYLGGRVMWEWGMGKPLGI